MSSDHVILVDETDAPIGTAEKLAAHREGWLHRAFSVLVLGPRDELLLQRRAVGKYHSGGLWSNTCCSHPRPGETTLDAAHRRLREEMGFDCPLTPAFRFVYRTGFGNGLVEHESDHVFLGRWTGVPDPDAREVDGWRWVPARHVRRDLARNPDRYTFWFREIMDRLHRRGLLPHAADLTGAAAAVQLAACDP